MINDIFLFIDILQTGSLTKTAAAHHMSKSQISRRLTMLEENLKTKLVTRTTRTLVPTESGNLFLQYCLQIQEVWNDALKVIGEQSEEISGEIKLTLPITWGSEIIMPHLAHFYSLYPNVRFSIDMSPAIRDIASEGYDLGFRVGEKLPNSSLKSRKLMSYSYVLCGSPHYFEKNGIPKTPNDLKHHSGIINMTLSPENREFEWVLSDNIKKYKIQVQRKFEVSNYSAQRKLALMGMGIVCIPKPLVKTMLAKKELVEILQTYEKPSATLWLLHPYHHTPPKKVRLLIDYLTEKLSSLSKISDP